jgi:hypothetical protein
MLMKDGIEQESNICLSGSLLLTWLERLQNSTHQELSFYQKPLSTYSMRQLTHIVAKHLRFTS